MKEISGTIVFEDIEGGFWGIVDENNNRYIPVNLPEQLKWNGKKSTMTIRYRDDISGIHMWGRYVEITAFQT